MSFAGPKSSVVTRAHSFTDLSPQKSTTSRKPAGYKAKSVKNAKTGKTGAGIGGSSVSVKSVGLGGLALGRSKSSSSEAGNNSNSMSSSRRTAAVRRAATVASLAAAATARASDGGAGVVGDLDSESTKKVIDSQSHPYSVSWLARRDQPAADAAAPADADKEKNGASATAVAAVTAAAGKAGSKERKSDSTASAVPAAEEKTQADLIKEAKHARSAQALGNRDIRRLVAILDAESEDPSASSSASSAESTAVTVTADPEALASNPNGDFSACDEITIPAGSAASSTHLNLRPLLSRVALGTCPGKNLDNGKKAGRDGAYYARSLKQDLTRLRDHHGVRKIVCLLGGSELHGVTGVKVSDYGTLVGKIMGGKSEATAVAVAAAGSGSSGSLVSSGSPASPSSGARPGQRYKYRAKRPASLRNTVAAASPEARGRVSLTRGVQGSPIGSPAGSPASSPIASPASSPVPSPSPSLTPSQSNSNSSSQSQLERSQTSDSSNTALTAAASGADAESCFLWKPTTEMAPLAFQPASGGGPGSSASSQFRSGVWAPIMPAAVSSSPAAARVDAGARSASSALGEVRDAGVAASDGGGSSLEEVFALCKEMAEYLARPDGHGVLVHCRGGIGRTGTLCACLVLYLLFQKCDRAPAAAISCVASQDASSSAPVSETVSEIASEVVPESDVGLSEVCEGSGAAAVEIQTRARSDSSLSLLSESDGPSENASETDDGGGADSNGASADPRSWIRSLSSKKIAWAAILYVRGRRRGAIESRKQEDSVIAFAKYLRGRYW